MSLLMNLIFPSSKQGKSRGFAANCSTDGKRPIYRQQTSTEAGRRTQITGEGEGRKHEIIQVKFTHNDPFFWGPEQTGF